MNMALSSHTWRRLIAVVAATGLLMASPAPSAAAKKDKKEAAEPKFTPESITLPEIESSIEKAVDALYEMKPRYTIPPFSRHHHRRWRRYYSTELGNHALAAWALLATGESYQMPNLYRRINLVLTYDLPFTYFRGMRAQMLAQLPRARWTQWVVRDASWFTGAVTTRGNFEATWTGGRSDAFGDHANGQYGVLGLWACERSGYPISNRIWRAIDQHWRRAQDPKTGGWAIGEVGKAKQAFEARVSGPMTAGGVSVLSLTERYLYGPKLTDVGKESMSDELRKGIDWLDSNFSLEDKAEQEDFYYYMWTIQRVGHVTGYRTFNDIDWYRHVTARLLNMQKDNGRWDGPKGELLSTGFALLYMAQARRPLAISKIRFDHRWNNRPHDVLNFVNYASDVFEAPFTWQIAELDQPAHELIESPMLYLATHESFGLENRQIENLRKYIDAGGLLVCVPEGRRTGDSLRSYRNLAERLFGRDADPVRIDRDHPFYSLHSPLSPAVKMQVVHNGVRPVMILFNRDIGMQLQTNDRVRTDSFVALSNIYLYVSGMNPRRARLDTHYVVQQVENPKNKLAAARVKHAGRYDPEPGAMRQVKATLANRHNVDLSYDVKAAGELDEEKIAFLTTVGDGELTPADAAALRKWLEAGGTLWIDAAGGDKKASDNAFALAEQILPETRTTPLGNDHPIITGDGLFLGNDNTSVRYRLFALRRLGVVTQHRLAAMQIHERPAIIISGEDLTAGLVGLRHWEIFGYSPESAMDLVVNGCLHAGEFKPPKPTTKE